SLSRRMMIGMFVIGSTIRPLIVISICMFAPEAVRVGPGNPHLHDLSHPRRVAREVHHRVARRPPRELPLAAAARRIDQYWPDPADRPGEQLPLDRLLEPLQRHDTTRLLF